MKNVNVKCVVHSNSFHRSTPLVMVTTVKDKEFINPSWDILNITERTLGSCVVNCLITGEIIEDKGETLLVRLKSDSEDIDMEVSNKEVESLITT
ncbi:MAG TPA: hypothetical protein ACFYD6_03965 [Candidatus Brocadiia bacterium]|nr:hypothetical protein [Candidatus Brocadiales bacterium]